ncbi:hypothetical protein EDC94DRAFT_612136 [Helicostylum pulchrum]|nr:hypothetical protein EDC94DRAFT_612136 [Helicostylum pulchrum]
MCVGCVLRAKIVLKHIVSLVLCTLHSSIKLLSCTRFCHILVHREPYIFGMSSISSCTMIDSCSSSSELGAVTT